MTGSAAYDRDLIGYGRTPPAAPWPGGARVAVQFVLNYEEGGENCILHGDEGSEGVMTDMPGHPTATADKRRNLMVESIYEYGSRAGIWRLMRMFGERNLHFTVFAIGMALAMRPVLLLLDEPTAGMGPEETRATGALVHSVYEEGVTIIVVEHDMAFVRQLGAPVTVLHYGRVFAEGSLAAIEGNEDVRNIYLGASRTMAVRDRHH